MADRKVQVVVDIVNDPMAKQKAKAVADAHVQAWKESGRKITAEMTASHKRIEAGTKNTNRIIEMDTRQRVNAEIREEKRLERERKRIANDFIRSMDALRRQQESTWSAFRGSFIGGFLGGAISGTVASGISSTISYAKQGASAVFDYTKRIQQAEIAFSTLMKSQAAAAKHIKDLRDLTVKYPLQFESIATMSQRLQGANIEAEKIIPLIRDIGNIAAATGGLGTERMEGLAVALSQIASKGKVSAEEMEQLAERGVPAWRILSEAIGKTTAETRTMAEKGEISSEQLFRAFQKFSRLNFGDAMEKQAKTFDGAMLAIKNVVLDTASEAFKPFYKEIEGLAVGTAKRVQDQRGDFAKIGETIGEAVGAGIVIAFKRMWDDTGPRGLVHHIMGGDSSYFWSTLQGLGKGVGNNPVGRGLLALAGGGDPSVAAITPWGNGKRNIYAGTPLSPVNSQVQNSAATTLPGIGQWNKQYDAKLKARENTKNNGDKLPAFGSMKSLVLSTGNQQWDAWFVEMGQKFNVDPNVLLLQAGQESSFKTSAVSNKGARGFSQFMPATAKRFGVDVTSVKDSIRGQAQYMSLLLSMFGGNYELALAGYNAGEGAVQKYGGIPRYKETQDYVAKIKGRYMSRVAGKEGAYGTYDPGKSAQEMADATSREMAALSDAKTKAYRDKIVDQAINVMLLTGTLPSDDFIKDVQRRMNEVARQHGVVQSSFADVKAQFSANAVMRAALVTAPAEFTPGPITNREMITTTPELEASAKRLADLNEEAARKAEEYREAQIRAFEDVARGWEDLFHDLADGNFKSIWDRMRRQMLDAFIKPASQYMAALFGGVSIPGVTPQMAGAGGFGNIGFGGTPGFNPSMNFAGGGQGGQQGGGLFGNLLGGGSGSSNSGGIATLGGLTDGNGNDPFAIAGKAGGGISGLLRGMGGGSKMAGMASMGGMAASLIGGAIGGKWGNLLTMGGMGASIGANFGPWGALIGAAIGTGAGFISMLFGRDNAEKKLKEAAAAEFGINISDKSVLRQLKQLGEAFYGKGQAGKNASAIVRSEEGMNILRAYATSSGQSGLKIDRLNYGDENWSGNQFTSRFGGFRASGGSVASGFSYIVGERGPELLTMTQGGGNITSNADLTKMQAALADSLYQISEQLGRLQTMPADQVVMMGANGASSAINDAMQREYERGAGATEQTHRNTGAYY